MKGDGPHVRVTSFKQGDKHTGKGDGYHDRSSGRVLTSVCRF